MAQDLWCYAVTFEGDLTRDDFVEALNTLPEVKNWYTCLSNTVFVVSPLGARDLSSSIIKVTAASRLLVVDLATDRNGWLPKEAWEFIRNPRSL